MPTVVSKRVEKGPFIVVTGHDLHDLKQLLEQTEGKGVDIYTHGEMLPAHGYPELKKYAHLKGNFGTAWQNQQKEFDSIPGALLFTTNCLMVPKPSYSDRVFTTAVVGFPGITHIAADKKGKKDFAPVIQKALELGGYPEDTEFKGINGGTEVTTGFCKKRRALECGSDRGRRKGRRHPAFLPGGAAATARGRAATITRISPPNRPGIR